MAATPFSVDGSFDKDFSSYLDEHETPISFRSDAEETLDV